MGSPPTPSKPQRQPQQQPPRPPRYQFLPGSEWPTWDDEEIFVARAIKEGGKLHELVSNCGRSRVVVTAANLKHNHALRLPLHCVEELRESEYDDVDQRKITIRKLFIDAYKSILTDVAPEHVRERRTRMEQELRLCFSAKDTSATVREAEDPVFAGGNPEQLPQGAAGSSRVRHNPTPASSGSSGKRRASSASNTKATVSSSP
ncbi:hypothetical protein JCM10908_006139 [Rhodotorula pacifica]|uniref:uncharacterized protein n=1 Tax=Rhodotorula pacifica TaxID=1495444 RepID=UPI003171088C